jgi:hypothetical protein
MKKKILCTIITGILLIASTTTAFAGTWKLNTKTSEWQYIKNNGSKAMNEWIYDNGAWYYIDADNMKINATVKSGNDKYYVGSDGKMLKGGFIQRNKYDRSFADKDGKLLGGLFMVDGVLYESGKDNKLLGIARNYPGKFGVIKPNGKELAIKCIYDEGKVLDENGQPFTEESNLFKYAQYIPKYDSQGNFLGAIDNGHKPVAFGYY